MGTLSLRVACDFCRHCLVAPDCSGTDKGSSKDSDSERVGPFLSGNRIVNEGIQAALNDSPYQLQFYSEYLDTSLFPDPAVQQQFRDFYIRKYQNRKPDVIITVGPSPLQFMEEVHQRVFPGVPIVFCLPTLNAPGAPAVDSDFTGVENDMAPAETLQIALRLQPGTKNVVVVKGVSRLSTESS